VGGWVDECVCAFVYDHIIFSCECMRESVCMFVCARK